MMTKEEKTVYHANYYRKNKNKWKVIPARPSAIRREEGQKLKLELFSHYGTVCQCCGEARLVFLAMDHIHGNGTQHRKLTGGGHNFYRWLRKNNYPSGFQVLCHNCNWARRDGICPHKLGLT